MKSIIAEEMVFDVGSWYSHLPGLKDRLKMLHRRDFLRGAALGAAFTAFGPFRLFGLEPLKVENPLAHYPERDWEKLYHDQYRYDGSFQWVCSPNDTHACRVMAYTRNGVITRMGSTYDYQDYKDLYGNHATANWNPRQCAKGYTFHRVVYGPFRLKHPIIRKGWKRWADDGFPYLTEENRKKYMFESRGEDTFEQIGWEEVLTYAAKGLKQIATTARSFRARSRRRWRASPVAARRFHPGAR